MPPSDTPLNKAHQHASNAEDYINQGLLILAEEHHKSAEAFLRCVEQASDEGTKRTLRMLYNEHNKSGKELQRKIAKLKDEGKDPNLPQFSPAPPPEPGYPSPSPGVPSTYSSRAIPRGRMSDSNHTIDESYMVLGQQSDPSDTFNQFWKALEGMLDNLSQPVAFATAPLAHLNTAETVQPSHQNPNASSNERPVRREGSSGSDEADFQVGLVPKYSGRTLGLGQPGRERNHYTSTVSSRPKGNSVQDAMEATIIPNTKTTLDTSDPEEVLADDDSPSGESFFMIPSATDSTLVTKLRQENASLKREITCLDQQLEIAERMRVAQEQQIRDRVSLARRETQRVMNSGILPQRPTQTSLDLSALNLNIPPLSAFSGPINVGREAQLVRRVKDLEEEVRAVRTENEKQKAMIAKFRERWDKLKESAKRKRSAKANGGSDNSNVREQRIDEEPEAEFAAEEDAELSKPR